MKTKFLLMILVILALGAGTLVMLKPGGGATEINHQHAAPAVAAPDTAPVAAVPTAPRIPAYQSASAVGNLPPTLPVSGFVGKTREAYEVAKKIPQTLAQLPCYCECDLGFGHKSLHTCFENDHAAGCAVCVDEALLAYKLQKEQKLTPEQVREKIIEKYSSEHAGHGH
ncbi:MAG: PCYCGC domain-containing protein [Pyrinomonadaceae bacterium]|nr:PCYCGC domain-containing protein [Pyrinomonadaceae bacterium]